MQRTDSAVVVLVHPVLVRSLAPTRRPQEPGMRKARYIQTGAESRLGIVYRFDGYSE